MISGLTHLVTRWYIAAPVLAILGIVIGYQLFFNVFSGKPKIGIIDIPFTVINEDSAFVITAYLDYARRDPSIKGAVIRLTSPGGGATSSEQLFIETRKLREEKPVVIVMNGLVASGGYMMAMGANHTYVKSSSLVGNVGVISFAGPLVPSPPDENMISTGPFKLSGSSRRGWISLMDQLKQSFAQMVIMERGDKMRISEEDLLQGQLFAGLEAVRLGLADEIGNDTDAFNKVAELAGINTYDIVDVNIEVNRLFVQQIRRIFSSSDDVNAPLTESDRKLMAMFASNGRAGSPNIVSQFRDGTGTVPEELFNLEAVRRPLEYGVMGSTQEEPLPEFPMEINKSNIYYLYVGNTP
ncbi:MAG: S49 family peptidase [Dehalococcoidia bacterium]